MPAKTLKVRAHPTPEPEERLELTLAGESEVFHVPTKLARIRPGIIVCDDEGGIGVVTRIQPDGTALVVGWRGAYFDRDVMHLWCEKVCPAEGSPLDLAADAIAAALSSAWKAGGA